MHLHVALSSTRLSSARVSVTCMQCTFCVWVIRLGTCYEQKNTSGRYGVLGARRAAISSFEDFGTDCDKVGNRL